MTLYLIILLALGLCFDSFAVSLSTGISCCVWRRWRAVRFAAILALMQALMPLLGWFLAFKFRDLISFWDHWIAFTLLLFLGGKMIYGAVRELRASSHKELAESMPSDALTFTRSVVLGLATSIDACAAGVALAFVSIDIVQASPLVNILWAVVVIGVITFVASLVGLWLGRRSQGHLGSLSEIVGGVILIALGVKILIEHLC
ncbi:MAG: manganese efflux pump MntP family protein [Mucinivorans sp.]